MPYCTECGIRYEDKDRICVSCGQDLVVELEKNSFATSHNTQTAEVTRDEDMVVEYLQEVDINNLNRNRIKESQDNASLSENDRPGLQPPADSQLGKGIVKPQSMELGLDGFHFKYDLPRTNFIKAEPIKEKPQEYRVTVSESEARFVSKLEKDDLHIPENLLQNDQAEMVEVVETSMAGDNLNVDSAVQSESLTDEGSVELETEMILPAISLPEPELKMARENLLVWEGQQTWCRIPTGDCCQITEHSLIIFNKQNRKGLEVGLDLIITIEIRQNWISELLGIGDLLISVKNFLPAQIKLNGIIQPKNVKQIIENLLFDRI